jgi:putative membrane protein
MKRFNEVFRTKLYDTIQDIEDNSQIEIVLLIRPQSGLYRDIAVWAGMLFSFALFTFFMFSPFEFDVFMIYIFTILSFFAVYTLFKAVPEIGSGFIRKSRKEKNVEINARALFQKGGIRFTNKRIGTLIYFSLFEKKAFLLPDRGAQTAVPKEEWDKMENELQNVFSNPNMPEAILITLSSFKPIFSKYIPSVENDVNELPDDLNIEI